MKNSEPYSGFEQGPIRPPSEAESLLIRVTRNCPWNRCTFCPVYKGTRFSLRPVDHILKDIDMVSFYMEEIEKARAARGTYTRREFAGRAPDGEERDLLALNAAYHFVAGGKKSIFLQDGNSLIIKPDHLITILRHVRRRFPMVERITSYARSQTVARISDQNLGKMAEAGLNRIHIGMESGSDTVLERVKKGVDKQTHIKAGLKIKRAGMELSEYYMPGLGGKTLMEENARETADAMNRINPDFIRLRTLAMPEAAPLTQEYRAGNFAKTGDVETTRELLIFIESLQGITSTVKSDHVLNLFPELDGVLPQDKEKMLRPLKAFLELDPEDQMIFCVGRRTHRIAGFQDLTRQEQRDYVYRMCEELGATVDNFDHVIDDLMQRFI